MTNAMKEILKCCKKEKREAKKKIKYRINIVYSILVMIVVTIVSLCCSFCDSNISQWMSSLLLNLSMGMLTGLVLFVLSNKKDIHKERCVQALRYIENTSEFARRVTNYSIINKSILGIYDKYSLEEKCQSDFNYFQDNYEDFLTNVFSASGFMADQKVQVYFGDSAKNKDASWDKNELQKRAREILSNSKGFEDIYFNESSNYYKANKKIYHKLIPFVYFCAEVKRTKGLELEFNVNSVI